MSVALLMEEGEMKRTWNIPLAALVLLIAPLNSAQAGQKEKVAAMLRCDQADDACRARCAQLIDINNQVENCLELCKPGYDYCVSKADQLRLGQSAAPPITGGAGGVLDPGPRGPSRKPQGSQATGGVLLGQ
jgi:hypothetical protein